MQAERELYKKRISCWNKTSCSSIQIYVAMNLWLLYIIDLRRNAAINFSRLSNVGTFYKLGTSKMFPFKAYLEECCNFSLAVSATIDGAKRLSKEKILQCSFFSMSLTMNLIVVLSCDWTATVHFQKYECSDIRLKRFLLLRHERNLLVWAMKLISWCL